MFRIGDFSKLTRVSIKTLRYYDEVGLLRPGRVDPATGYRYYAADQMPRLNRILALRDLSFSLEQIGQLLEEGLSAVQLQGILRVKRVELQQRVGDEQARLMGIEAAACVVHHGPFTGLAQAYGALLQWIAAHGYRIVAPNRESYVRFDRDNPEQHVTELQFPVAKI